ncbi:MAG: gamma-glutamyl-gamma-aminobutyrate hydrolase family protein [Clostridiales bacterium]|nr:gamma-glutamyl-gamma-aminobutyrate hydrolase family protein [Clostridiales bacterium]
MITIGLSPNRDLKGGPDCMPWDYVRAVLRAGALPLILPMVPEGHSGYGAFLDRMLSKVDGIVFTGGPDIHPAHYGEQLSPQCKEPVSERDAIDLALFERVMRAGLPFLGICRGLQVCNVALGGSLYQDLPAQLRPGIDHQQPEVLVAHEVRVEDNSLLRRVTGTGHLPVTSRHHQAIKALAPGLVVSARSGDGIIEAVEFENGHPGLCVQWHPENLAGEDSRHQALFDWLAQAAAERA